MSNVNNFDMSKFNPALFTFQPPNLDPSQLNSVNSLLSSTPLPVRTCHIHPAAASH